MESLEHTLTEAILDYEDELLTMEHRERERYEPMARQRARFLADRLRDREGYIAMLEAENDRLRAWDAQLRQWIFDHRVQTGGIDLDGPPPGDEEPLTLDEVRSLMRLDG